MDMQQKQQYSFGFVRPPLFYYRWKDEYYYVFKIKWLVYVGAMRQPRGFRHITCAFMCFVCVLELLLRMHVFRFGMRYMYMYICGMCAAMPYKRLSKR